MPTEEVVAAAQEAQPEPEQSLSEYRRERETPQAAEAAPDKGKTAAEPVAAKPETQTGEKGSDKPSKPKRTFEERFDEVYGNWRRAQDKVEELQRQLQEVQSRQAEPAKPAPENGQKPRPKEEDYKTWDEYQEAVLDWKLEQRLEERLAKAREEAEEAEAHQAQQSEQEIHKQNFAEFEKAKQPFIAAHDDYDTVVSQLDDLVLPGDILSSIVMLGAEGVEVGYELAKNRKVAESIVQQYTKAAETGNPRYIALAHREFWGFVRSLSPESKAEAKPAAAAAAPPKEVPKPVSNAPEPIKPVAGGTGPADVNEANISIAEYRRQREQGRIR